MLALLQFDAASLPLLDRLLAEDRLPTIRALKQSGSWIALDASATMLQSATYPTLCTGLDVSVHGLYSAFPWSAADQRARFAQTFPKPPTIWERLTRARRRSLVIDPILAWPPSQISGIYVSGWGFEDRMVAQARSVPSSVRDMLTARHGRSPHLDDVYGRRHPRQLVSLRRHLSAAPARTADAAVDLLGRESFDLAWINFSAAHKAGHQLWDPAAVSDGPLEASIERDLRAGLEDVYVEVDRAIGRVLQALPPDTTVIVFSPTGMDTNTSRADLLPAMVRAIVGTKQQRAARGDVSESPVWALRSRIPPAWRASVARLLPDRVVADITTRFYLRADWQHTRAVAVPGENKGYIRFNLRGRERDGIVTAAETDELRETIVDGLMSFRDPDGAPAIACVAPIQDVAGPGPAFDRLPDLVVYWSDRSANRVTGAVSPKYGEIRRHGVGSGRSGNHVDDGWAIVLTGKSKFRDGTRPPRVTDLGATICHLLDAPADGLSGTPLMERG